MFSSCRAAILRSSRSTCNCKSFTCWKNRTEGVNQLFQDGVCFGFWSHPFFLQHFGFTTSWQKWIEKISMWNLNGNGTVLHLLLISQLTSSNNSWSEQLALKTSLVILPTYKKPYCPLTWGWPRVTPFNPVSFFSVYRNKEGKMLWIRRNLSFPGIDSWAP